MRSVPVDRSNMSIRVGTVGHIREGAGPCSAAIVTEAAGLVARTVTLVVFGAERAAAQRRVGIPVILHPVESSPESFHPLGACPDDR